MKKILIFFTFIVLIGCSSIKKSNNEVVNISCPTVFFSSESSTYVPGFEDNIDLDKDISKDEKKELKEKENDKT